MKDGVFLAQERQQLGIRCNELKVVGMKTQLDSLQLEMDMQEELIQESWALEESKTTMLLKIMSLEEEIKKKDNSRRFCTWT